MRQMDSLKKSITPLEDLITENFGSIGSPWKFRRKVTPLRSYESDPLFRWKVTP